ncbi:Beta-lactamase hydrolase-like protein [Novipirellula galeiformis]|uniref:Beta-lactamase hydrolase-like protein n=1 Tax=Novipirellula galeiformis TaxID=2528004 RepID=A0A5C6CHU6_9BACT|nr:protein tyrosine phosphatase family protein [Novipirellula galeiformis]TWU23968.1 Beta-lactamase hydrolase-like protein [Novipirellula galeiformis]
MSDKIKLNDQVMVGEQPSESEIDQLGQQGFKTVINFRAEGEEGQPLSPDAEGAKVQAAGMEYLHLPVSMKSMGPELVDRFRTKYPDLPKPVFAHCKSGKRAGAMVVMQMAVEQGMTGAQTLEKAKEMGFECDQPELEQFVRQYVDSHSKAKPA